MFVMFGRLLVGSCLLEDSGKVWHRSFSIQSRSFAMLFSNCLYLAVPSLFAML